MKLKNLKNKYVNWKTISFKIIKNIIVFINSLINQLTNCCKYLSLKLHLEQKGINANAKSASDLTYFIKTKDQKESDKIVR